MHGTQSSRRDHQPSTPRFTLAYYDIETRSELNLKKVGAYRYATDESTEVRCVGYALDDGPVKLWTPDQPVPKDVADHIKRGDLCVAFNASFERQIHTRILGPRHGWPVPKLEQYRCLMAMSLALGLPGSLEDACAVMGVGKGKGLGKKVMLQMAQPRKARKGEDPEAVHWFDDEARAEQLHDYCTQDVRDTRELFNRLWQLSDEEQAVWETDQRINDRGFHVDEQLLRAMRRIIIDAVADINVSIRQKTGGAVESVDKIVALKTWLREMCGLTVAKSLNKATIPLLIADPKTPARAKEVLELRLAGAQAATKKVDAFLARRNGDGRVRGWSIYHAAGTGRFAGRGSQIHNLKRLTTENQDEIATAVDDLMTKDYRTLKVKYARPLQIIGDNIRACIDAAPGNILIGADFSGIEARVTAWLAGEERKLQVFRDYDAGKGPDPYVVAAAGIYGIPAEKITKPQRQVGKGAGLAFGFQGSVNAYKKFVPDGAFTDAEIEGFKNKWRRMHPNIVEFWARLKSAGDRIAKAAVQIRRGVNHTIEPMPVRNVWFEHDSGYMFIVLPSGRRISYPIIDRAYRPQDFYQFEKPADRDFSLGQLSTCFMDNSSGHWHRVFWYGGFGCENITQGVARDLLAEAMVRIDKAGLPIVVHCHDEIVIEVPEKHADKVAKQFTKLMTTLPEWAQGTGHDLPVVAKPFIARRYVK